MHDAFDALAHPVRREILKLLRTRPMSAGALADRFDLAKPTLSGHFATLKNADLIRAERRGTTIIYQAPDLTGRATLTPGEKVSRVDRSLMVLRRC